MGFSFSDYYLNELRGSVLTMLKNAIDEDHPLAFAITDGKVL